MYETEENGSRRRMDERKRNELHKERKNEKTKERKDNKQEGRDKLIYCVAFFRCSAFNAARKKNGRLK
jgi:hypothetical protein